MIKACAKPLLYKYIVCHKSIPFYSSLDKFTFAPRFTFHVHRDSI